MTDPRSTAVVWVGRNTTTRDAFYCAIAIDGYLIRSWGSGVWRTDAGQVKVSKHRDQFEARAKLNKIALDKGQSYTTIIYDDTVNVRIGAVGNVPAIDIEGQPRKVISRVAQVFASQMEAEQLLAPLPPDVDDEPVAVGLTARAVLAAIEDATGPQPIELGGLITIFKEHRRLRDAMWEELDEIDSHLEVLEGIVQKRLNEEDQ